MDLSAELVFRLALNAFQLGLAGALLYLNFTNRANRALALVMILRSASSLWRDAPGLVGSAEVADLAPRLQPYFALAYYPAIFYFASVYPELRRWIAKLPVPALPFLVGIAALDLAYAADHALYRDASGGQGPLSVLLALLAMAFPVAALLFARDAARSPAGNRRNSLLLLSMGFALIQAYDVLAYLFASVAQQSGSGAQSLGVSAWPQLAVFAVLAGYLAWLGARSPDADLRARSRRYLMVLGALAATALAVIAGARGAAPFFEILWDFALPVFVGYALLRHQMFGIDLKIRFAVRQSTLAGVFVGLFFVVSEGAQQIFSSEVGPFLGIAAAGMLLFALSPLQHFAEHVARATVPNAKPALQLNTHEKATIFRDAARTAWADGLLDKNERAMLEQLRVTLGMSREEAGSIEHEAAG